MAKRKLDLGRVVGQDAGFGEFRAYVEVEGHGEAGPQATVESSGPDSAKDFVLTLKNVRGSRITTGSTLPVTQDDAMVGDVYIKEDGTYYVLEKTEV